METERVGKLYRWWRSAASIGPVADGSPAIMADLSQPPMEAAEAAI